MDFGIVSAFLHAGIVNKIIFLFLVVLSIYSWTLIFKKVKEFKAAKLELSEFSSEIMFNPDSKAYALRNDNEYSDIIQLCKNYNKKDKTELKNVCDTVLSERLFKLENSLFFLATIATSAPFIGLLGTVIGVINSFNEIGTASSASLAVIAPGIAEALYATAFGLFVAIPAAVFYNIFTNYVSKFEEEQNAIVDRIIFSI